MPLEVLSSALRSALRVALRARRITQVTSAHKPADTGHMTSAEQVSGSTCFYSGKHNEPHWEQEHADHPDWEMLVNADRSYPVYGLMFCAACEDTEQKPDHASCAAYTTNVDPEWCECECWMTWKPSWRQTTDQRVTEQGSLRRLP